MAAVSKKIGFAVVRVVNSIVNVSVLMVFLIMAAFAVYAMWDADQVYQAADAAQYAVYKPAAQDEGVSFEQLQNINKEVFSWLTVYGTNIDYPVTQGEDNMKYVNTDAYGNYSLSGAVFLDSINNKNFEDFNSILYGHHMEKQAMFGEIDRFNNKIFFDSHMYGNLYYSGQNHGLEFFAFIKTDAYDEIVFTPAVQGEAAQNKLLEALYDKALYTRNIGVTNKDRILLLTTCSSDATNGRDILAARITNKSYFNPFNSDETDDEYQQAYVDSRFGILGRIPIWVRIAVPIIFFLVIIIVLINIRKKHRKG